MKASRIAPLACILFVFNALSAHAAGGDPEAGRRKTVTCNGCHGQSSMQSVPNLGGQSPTYFIAAMRAYQDDVRGHATMRDVAKAFTDKDIRNFAAYYAQFGKRESADASVNEKPAGSALCETCHGPEGRVPVNPESAVLAGQKSSYLKSVLREYRDGKRKQAVMQGVVANLTDAQIEALGEYYSRLEGLAVK